MQLAWGPEEEAFRAELVTFLDEHVPPEASVGFDYADSGPVQGVLAACGAVHEHADYGEHVDMVVRVPSARADALCIGVRDATASRARAELVRSPGARELG